MSIRSDLTRLQDSGPGLGAAPALYDARLEAAHRALGRLIAALDEGKAPAFLALPERIDDRDALERDVPRAREARLGSQPLDRQQGGLGVVVLSHPVAGGLVHDQDACRRMRLGRERREQGTQLAHPTDRSDDEVEGGERLHA